MGFGEVRAGKAFVEVYTKDSTQGGLDGIKSKFGSFAGQIAKIGGVAVTAATAAVTASVMKAVNTGANIGDLAARYSLGTEAIQQLSYAAKQSGTNLETLITGIKNMQKGLGGGTLSDELKAVGLSLEQLKNLSPEQQFATIAEAIGRLSDPAERTAMAMKFFGKSGADLLPLLKAGEGGVKALSVEFDRLGITMSEEAVKEAAALDDELVKLGMQWDAMVVAIGSEVIPALREMITWMNKMRTNSPLAHGVRAAGRLEPLKPEVVATAKGTGDTPLGKFIAGLGDRLGAAKDVDRAIKVKAGLDAIWDALRENGLRRRDMAARNIEKLPGNALINAYKYLAGEKIKADIGSYGSFDKRDIRDGAYLQATQQQLAELKEINRHLKEIEAKKDGIKWD